MAKTPSPPSSPDAIDWPERTKDVVRWLIEGAPGVDQPHHVLKGLCDRLAACDFPLHRVAVFVTTLHPNIYGRGFLWRHDRDAVDVVAVPFDILASDDYRDNPIPHVLDSRQPLRRRLCDADCPDDFSILEELRAEGVTDYLMQPLIFIDGQVHVVSWTTRQAGGFTDSQVAALHMMQAAFSRIAEIYALRRTAGNLLDAYLGHRSGERVLNGQIQRGDGVDIHAVIWFSDLRGSTTLADSIPRGQFLVILNHFFECMAGAVLDHDGEVLRFIGDSVLAIFPIERDGDTPVTAESACADAVAAARDALARIASLNEERRGAGEDPLGCGIALHLGDVMYGNIGVPTRVEFSVIGAAANEAARLEGMCKTLGQSFLVSSEVAQHHPGPWRSLGSHKLRGVGDDHEVFTLDGG